MVVNIVDRYMQENTGGRAGGAPSYTVDPKINRDALEVDVWVTERLSTTMGSTFGLSVNEVTVRSLARVAGRPNICVLALDASASGAISLEKNANVVGERCAVFSNSKHNHSIKSKNSSLLAADVICSAGGKDGGPGNFTPEPQIDCPTFEDPLADRPEPFVAACDPDLPSVVESSRTLRPGTYCGGLHITNGASVVLEPGVYVIRNGELRVDENALLEGKGVGFFFTGPGATFQFERASSIAIEAPADGPMAGLLMFESRSQPTKGTHKVLSNDARTLLGTIYLSRGRLQVDADSPVADKSAYTAIVARQLTLSGGPKLVLNTNYDRTDVPVPVGIRGAGQPVALVK